MEQKTRDSAEQELEMSYDPRRCHHTPECDHSLHEVFDAEPPWLDPTRVCGALGPRSRDLP